MRHPDWQIRIITTIQAATERPFCWGENDCCLFVADVCLAACDKDPAAHYRGRYTTEIGAKRVLAKTHGSISARASSGTSDQRDGSSGHYSTLQAMRGA